MPRASWKGFIRLSLVSIPVQAYTAAASEQGQIQFHQLHDQCHSRIRYQKVCPIHGEVPNEQIVKGYEYAKGQYVIVAPEELDKLHSESDRAVNIDRFVPPDQVGLVYLDGRTYYLTPDGPAGKRAYALLREALRREGLVAVAQVVLSGREELVLLWPLEELLCLSTLRYASQLKGPSLFRDEAPANDFSARELELTRSLVEATRAERFDPSQYEDLYTRRLTALIEAKVAGREIVAPPAESAPPVINLMDALKASLARTHATDQPGRKATRGNAKRPAGSRGRSRKKTG